MRLDAASNRETRLLFCTTGILLRRLSSDPLLHGTSHVIVDEVRDALDSALSHQHHVDDGSLQGSM